MRAAPPHRDRGPRLPRRGVLPRRGDGHGDDVLYIFDHGYGDCPEGCTAHEYWGFRVDEEGAVTELGGYATEKDTDAPTWFVEATACRKWL